MATAVLRPFDPMDLEDKSLIFEWEKLNPDFTQSNSGNANSTNTQNNQGAMNLDEDELTQNPNEVCKYFLKGTCQRGKNCPFKHSKMGEKAIVCKHWLRGLCKKGDLCEFLHEYDLSKMPECYFFSKFGKE